MNTTESNGGSMNMCSGGMGTMRSLEDMSRRRRRESVYQRERHWADGSHRRIGGVGQRI